MTSKRHYRTFPASETYTYLKLKIHCYWKTTNFILKMDNNIKEILLLNKIDNLLIIYFLNTNITPSNHEYIPTVFCFIDNN